MSKTRPVFKEHEGKNKDKIWCNAFTEHYGDKISYEKYSTADTLRIISVSNCGEYQELMAYVLQFDGGGFWLEDGILYVVTSGSASDIDSSYNDAVKFIKNWTKGEVNESM